MRNQRRSECIRGGEPQSHIDSANEVCKVVEEYPLYISMQRKDMIFPDGYKHQFDVVIAKITHFVEMGDVGDNSKHQLPHKAQLINDGIAKSHVEEYLPDVKYMKMNKNDSEYHGWVREKLELQ